MTSTSSNSSQSKKKGAKARVRPLLVRPGAKYTCFGDGLCCTNIHGLGPITKAELVQVRKIDPQGAAWDDDFEDRMLSTRPDGGCHFLMPDLRCGIHATHGPEAKPEGCRQFPLGLVATPDGGRITTRHRCPCRTLGDRPDIDVDASIPSISDDEGNLAPEDRIKRIRLGRKKNKVDWATWRAMEDEMLADLAAGVRPEEVLGVPPFPKLKKSSWSAESDAFVDAIDGTSFGFAIAWFGETVRALVIEGYEPRFPVRTWSDAFDRAEARPGTRTEDDVLSDWVADEIWSLEWNSEAGWEVARVELATRLAVARDVAHRLQSDHALGPGRAAAEALMIVELVGESDFWSEVVERIRA